MLGPIARSRALAGAAAALTLFAASAVLGGTASGGGSVHAATRVPFVGPVAPGAQPRPLVRTDGPLLPPTVRTARLVPVLRPVGPRAGAVAALVGPAVTVGPSSPVPAVRRLQRLLNATGAQLRVDGSWGPATTRAVLALQARAGLPMDGVAGPSTLAVLQGRNP